MDRLNNTKNCIHFWNVLKNNFSRVELLYLSQVFILYLIIIFALCSLIVLENIEILWVILLSFSLGCLLPSPKLY